MSQTKWTHNTRPAGSVTPLSGQRDKETAYGVLNENQGQAMMCSFRFRDGTSEAVPYMDIRRIQYHPSTGLVVPLRDHSTTIIIRGRHLEKIRNGLESHKVRWIQEGDPDHDDTPEEKTFVSAITWVEREEEE